MKTKITFLNYLSLIVLLLIGLRVSAQEIGGTFDARFEAELGKTHLQNSHWMVTRSTEWTPIAANFAGAYRGAAANFLAEENGTKVALYFTAETQGNSMEVRAIVDGVAMDPGAITFSSGQWLESRAFVFTGTFDEGIHSIQMEWRSLQNNQPAYIRDASILIRKDDSKNVGQMAIKSMMVNSTITSNSWVDVPNSLLHIGTKSGDVLVASAALETVVAPGQSLYLRALVNGIPMLPTDVLFAQGNTFQAKTMTFGFNGLRAGKNSVKFQWKVSGNGPAGVQGRSFVASAMPKDATNCEPHMKFKAAPSGPNISTSSFITQPIPHMDMVVSIPENGEMAVIFSAESFNSTGSQTMVCLEMGGKVYLPNKVILANGNKYLGVHSFVFVLKHIHAKSQAGLENVKLLWAAPNGGTAFMGDRSMTVLVEKGGTPDLAEPPNLGSVDNPMGGAGGIEPMQGTIPLLTVIIDPGQAHVPSPSQANVTDLLFGSHSTRDYFEKVSGGRFSLSNAGVFYVAPNLPDPDIYWTQHSCNCAADPECDITDPFWEIGYTGGHQRKWVHAMEGINAAFNFAHYDKNKDGILDPRELAILIITPAKDDGGTMREFKPYCQGHPNVPNTPGGAYYADGVRFLAITEWYTDAQDSMDFVTPTHELAHLLLNIGDLYVVDRDVYTEAAQYDLMGVGEGLKASPHLQGRTKLALGWATPVFIRNTTFDVKVSDVRTSEKVIILPRTNGVDGKEFFLLENRGNKDIDAHYDENIVGTGIAIWHIVESDGDYHNAPLTDACELQWQFTDHGKARRSSRLIRLKKGVEVAPNAGGGGGAGGGGIASNSGPNRELWKAVYNGEEFGAYNLTSFGFVCPDNVLNDGFGTMALVWADYAPSGYSIINWPTYGVNMYLDIVAPPMGMGMGTGAPLCPDDSQPGGVIGGKRRESFAENAMQLESLCEAYPNPFHEQTHFSFSMKQDCQVKLEIFNLHGQLVAKVFEGRVGAGEKQEISWRPDTHLASGLYLYRLVSDSGEILQGKLNWQR